MEFIEFSKVEPTEAQIETLYSLLKKREHVISHVSLPPFELHKQFVVSHPYRAWYIVLMDKNPAGSFYVSNENTVGINIGENSIDRILARVIDYVRSHYNPLPEIKSVRGSRFVINVSPTNVSLCDALGRLKKNILQISYSLE